MFSANTQQSKKLGDYKKSVKTAMLGEKGMM
jgi:hypothetical protein